MQRDSRNNPSRFSLLSAIAGVFGSSWSESLTGGNRKASKAHRKDDATRRARANKRLRKNGGAPRWRNRHSCRVNPPGTKAYNKAAAGQLGVTRRGY